jgi:hypothetical protein
MCSDCFDLLSCCDKSETCCYHLVARLVTVSADLVQVFPTRLIQAFHNKLLPACCNQLINYLLGIVRSLLASANVNKFQ